MALEWPQHFSHYKSMGIFPDAQGQLTPQAEVEPSRNPNSSKMLWLSLLPARMKKIQSKMKLLEWPQHFPQYNSIGAIYCHVLIRPGPKPNAAFPSMMLIVIGLVVLEIFKIESVNARTDARTPARLPYYKLTL